MSMKPYSNYLTSKPSDVDKFPALKIFWHHKDYNVGEQSWTDRAAGIKVIFKDPLRVDPEEGMAGDQANTIVRQIGDIPSLSNHIMLGITGRLEQNSSELLSSLGEAPNSYPQLSTSGLMFTSAGSFMANTPAMIPTPPTSGEQRTLNMAQVDTIDTTSPKISTMQPVEGIQGIPFGSGTTISTGRVVFGSDFKSVFFTPLTNEITPDWFLRTFFVFDFQDPVSDEEMKIAGTEMMRTGELFAGWAGRP